jgi:glycosyltransferase involved in cell wall biosynthesis
MFGPVASGCKFVAGHYRIDRYKPAWEWAIARRLGERAARFVTNSEAVREWHTQMGLPAEKFEIVPSCIAPARASDVSRETLLHELGLPADAKLIGVVGKLLPEKRTKDLIWAADLLRVLHNNLRLLVIGDGMLRSQLEEYAWSASDLDHIRFLGEGGDLWRIMPHLDVLWNGGENVAQSATILEAMAAGVPVIASDTPVNREVVADGETGYLIPPGTRAGRAARARLTDQIFTNAESAAKLAEASRRRALQSFAAESAVAKYCDLYQRAS